MHYFIIKLHLIVKLSRRPTVFSGDLINQNALEVMRKTFRGRSEEIEVTGCCESGRPDGPCSDPRSCMEGPNVGAKRRRNQLLNF